MIDAEKVESKLSVCCGARAKRATAHRQAPSTEQPRTRGRTSVGGADCFGTPSGAAACLGFGTTGRHHLSGTLLLYTHGFYCHLTYDEGNLVIILM